MMVEEAKTTHQPKKNPVREAMRVPMLNGYDLARMIATAVARRKTAADGALTGEGWQAPPLGRVPAGRAAMAAADTMPPERRPPRPLAAQPRSARSGPRRGPPLRCRDRSLRPQRRAPSARS